eukprot:3640744-Prymnesium_polylepis.1
MSQTVNLAAAALPSQITPTAEGSGRAGSTALSGSQSGLPPLTGARADTLTGTLGQARTSRTSRAQNRAKPRVQNYQRISAFTARCDVT